MEALRTAENRAASALVNFAKSNRATPTGEEVKAVEEAMRLAGCNDTSTGRADRRRIEAWSLLRDCITSTTRAELRRVEVAVMEIAGR